MTDRIKIIPKAEMLAVKQHTPAIFDEIFAALHYLSQLKEQNKRLANAVDYACRNLVTPPIKGEITRGKVKWRGLRLVFLPSDLKMKKDGDKMKFSCEQRVELWQRDKKIF